MSVSEIATGDADEQHPGELRTRLTLRRDRQRRQLEADR